LFALAAECASAGDASATGSAFGSNGDSVTVQGDVRFFGRDEVAGLGRPFFIDAPVRHDQRMPTLAKADATRDQVIFLRLGRRQFVALHPLDQAGRREQAHLMGEEFALLLVEAERPGEVDLVDRTVIGRREQGEDLVFEFLHGAWHRGDTPLPGREKAGSPRHAGQNDPGPRRKSPQAPSRRTRAWLWRPAG
jgi:hypothetical protein